MSDTLLNSSELIPLLYGHIIDINKGALEIKFKDSSNSTTYGFQEYDTVIQNIKNHAILKDVDKTDLLTVYEHAEIIVNWIYDNNH